MSDLNGYYESIQMGLPALFYSGREKSTSFGNMDRIFFCKIMALNAERIYDQALEASKKEANTIIGGLSKKDFTLLRYCLEK
ncbi:MAG: hypothetical protein L6U99_06930 [Clostridium sp.]|nr:MAG: hypothetical protein L6U99_06930 [Clostridium sp.]